MLLNGRFAYAPIVRYDVITFPAIAVRRLDNACSALNGQSQTNPTIGSIASWTRMRRRFDTSLGQMDALKEPPLIDSRDMD
jgi:hypothetical protein